MIAHLVVLDHAFTRHLADAPRTEFPRCCTGGFPRDCKKVSQIENPYIRANSRLSTFIDLTGGRGGIG
jgi:hypothetical protein